MMLTRSPTAASAPLHAHPRKMDDSPTESMHGCHASIFGRADLLAHRHPLMMMRLMAAMSMRPFDGALLRPPARTLPEVRAIVIDALWPGNAKQERVKRHTRAWYFRRWNGVRTA